jgi:flagellar basal-body rod modification protein FlgD
MERGEGMMAEVSALPSSIPTTASLEADAASIDGMGGELGRDTFLRLLTTQMQNQDPSSPMDNGEFVAQLAQFSSLEQLMGIQSNLESVYLAISAMNNAAMANLLGTEVVAIGNGIHIGESGSVDLHWEAATGAATASITVLDGDGHPVYNEELGSIEAGEGSFTWDGLNENGERVSEGDYTFVVNAFDQSGQPVAVQTLVVGTIDEMDYSNGGPQPSIDGTVVDIGSILRLKAGEDSDG